MCCCVNTLNLRWWYLGHFWGSCNKQFFFFLYFFYYFFMAILGKRDGVGIKLFSFFQLCSHKIILCFFFSICRASKCFLVSWSKTELITMEAEFNLMQPDSGAQIFFKWFSVFSHCGCALFFPIDNWKKKILICENNQLLIWVNHVLFFSQILCMNWSV